MIGQWDLRLHNQAFQHCNTPLFSVINPDIRLGKDPFPPLIDTLLDNNCALAAPIVCNPEPVKSYERKRDGDT